MTITILNKALTESWESKPINLEIDRKQSNGKKYNLSFLEILWTSVSGTLDGILSIYFNSYNGGKALERKMIINSETNSNDSQILLADQRTGWISFSFEKNGVSSGTIRINANYKSN